jgi:hypothetical protein
MGLFKKKKTPIDTLKQAYQQTPWRMQLQSIAHILLPVITLGIMSLLYLNISAQAATAGLQIRNLQHKEEEISRQIANLHTQLAWNTSFTNMHKRAASLGYGYPDSTTITYMVIPGYQGRKTAIIAPPQSLNLSVSSRLNPQFQESLWDKLFNNLLTDNQAGS